MKLTEFNKPLTAKSLNESLAKKFGQKINLEKFTNEQLEDVRNRLRTELSQIETNESFQAVNTEKYSKSRLFLDVINAEIAEREGQESVVKEGREEKAQIVVAAKDMVDTLTGWMEKTAEMQTGSMLELSDSIRDNFGSQQSDQFTAQVKPALEELYNIMEKSREILSTGVGVLTGEEQFQEPMGADDMGDDMGDDMEPIDTGADDLDLDLDSDDDFGSDSVSAGGGEEGGREKRESVNRNLKKK